MFPIKVVAGILKHVYLSCAELAGLEKHFCSLKSPCVVTSREFGSFFALRLVSPSWNDAIQVICSSEESAFFSRVEHAYYPHAWHINTKVRKSILLNRYRVFYTISTEYGDRGVYLAYDISHERGCAQRSEVVVKAWVSATDGECVMESAAYNALSSPLIHGVPFVLVNAHDPYCDVYAIVLQRLGPSLDDLQAWLPNGRFDERMVLAVAIQLLDRYKDIHARGIIHNGIKPGNICLSPPQLHKNTFVPTLYSIDFGLSFFLDLGADHPLPSSRRLDTVGNRRFLSIFGHHGISQSQRDDLESLAYLLSFLYHGFLPWDLPSLPLTSTPLKLDSKPQIWRLKMSTPVSALFVGMDRSFVEFFKDVRALAFAEVPDYDHMKKRFEECWRRKQYGGQPGEVDWWAIYERAKDEHGLIDGLTVGLVSGVI